MADIVNGERIDLANETIFAGFLDISGQVHTALALSHATRGRQGPRELRDTTGAARYGPPKLSPAEKYAMLWASYWQCAQCTCAHSNRVPWIAENPNELEEHTSLFKLHECPFLSST